MERHPKQLHIRMSEKEMARARRLADACGLTLSDLVRCLLQLPADAIENGTRLVVVDRASAA